MSERFHEKLNGLDSDVREMAELSKEMLRKSVKALKDQDAELTGWVLDNKGRIIEMDQQIENKTLRLVTLFQPMASDMRKIATIMKLNTYLARIGRYGKDIATIAADLTDNPHVAKLVSLPHMAEIVVDMIDDAIEVFRTGETSKFESFGEKDDALDAMRYSIFRECLTQMMEDPRTIKRCTHYIMIARYLERCGDHACKMAEKIYYMHTGEHIEIR